MRVCSLAVLAAAASLASLAAADGLPSPDWPRRALLQAQNRQNREGFDIKHLMVFAGLMVALAFSIVVIGCLCVRYRQWLPNDGIMRPPPGIFRRRQPEVILQDAKPQALPIIVVMPDNGISYAHKLLPEEHEEERRSAAELAASRSGSADGSHEAGSSGSCSCAAAPADAATPSSEVQLAEAPAASRSQATVASRGAVQQAAAIEAAAAPPPTEPAVAAGGSTQPAETTAPDGRPQQQRPADAAAGRPMPPRAAADAAAAPQQQQLGRRTYATGWVGRNWSAAALGGTPSAGILPPPQAQILQQQPPRAPEVRLVPAFIECDGETVHFVPEPGAASAASDASAAGGSSADVSVHSGSANAAAAPQLRTASASLVGRLLRRSSRRPHAADMLEQQEADRRRSSHRRSASRDSVNTGYFNRVLFDQ